MVGSNDVAPQVCQSETWSIPVTDPDVELATVGTPSGAAVAWATRAGSSLMAVNIDAGWQLATQPNTVQNAYSYTMSAVTYAGGMLVFGTNDGSAIKIEVVPPDMANVPTSTNEAACPTMTTHVADVPLLVAGPDYVSPMTTAAGMQILPFTTDWAQGTIQLTVPSSEPTDITSASLGTSALVAWSTANSCYVEHVFDGATGTGSHASSPCPAPRLAASTSDVALAFEGPGGIALAVGAPDALDVGAADLIAAGGSSPRVAFDGAHYWIAWADGSGNIVVGYRADDGTVPTVAIASDALARAYTLSILDAQPWLFAMDASGLSASRLCTP